MNTADEPRVVPARVADLEPIADLAARVWRVHYPGIITHAQIDYMLERMYSLAQMTQDLAEGIRYDRLLVGGELVGFAAHGPALDEPGAGKLHKLYVDPTRHGRGLGRILLDAAEQRAQDEGWTHLILQVNKRNEKAIAFYQRTGFSVRESAVFDVGGGFVMDDYVMMKPIAPGPQLGEDVWKTTCTRSSSSSFSSSKTGLESKTKDVRQDGHAIE